MNKLFSLIKVINKCSAGSYAMSRKKNRSSNQVTMSIAAKTVGYTVLGLLGLGFAIMIGFMAYGIVPIFTQRGNLGNAINFVLLLSQAIMFIMIIPKIMSMFFLSSDLGSYIHMPIKPSHIVLAKLLATVPYTYTVVGVFTFPACLGALIGSGANPSQYLAAVLCCVTAPILPVIVISVLSIILMHLCKNVKKKENIVTAITYIISAAFVFLYLFSGFGNSSEEISDAQLANMAESISGLKWIFPSNAFFSYSTENGNLVSLLIGVLIPAAAVLIFMWIAQRFYLESALGGMEGGARRKKTQALRSDAFSSSTAVKSLSRLERRTIFRSPIYLINCFLYPLIMPVVMIISFISSFSSVSDSTDALSSLISDSSHVLVYSPFISVFLAAMTAAVCKVSSTCISRDGKGFFALKAMPVTMKKRISVKYSFALKTNLLISLPFALGASLYLIIAMNVNPISLLFSVILSSSAAAIITDLQLFLEVRNPKLSWESEEAVVKESRGVLIGMLGALILMIPAVIAMLGCIFLGIPDLVMILIWAVIFLAVAILLHFGVLSFGAKNLTNFEA